MLHVSFHCYSQIWVSVFYHMKAKTARFIMFFFKKQTTNTQRNKKDLSKMVYKFSGQDLDFESF